MHEMLFFEERGSSWRYTCIETIRTVRLRKSQWSFWQIPKRSACAIFTVKSDRQLWIRWYLCCWGLYERHKKLEMRFRRSFGIL